MSTHKINVEVAYATAERQAIISLTVPPQTTAAAAISQSCIAVYFPEIDLAKNKIGIFGTRIGPDMVLRDRDRVEIYRSLIADPKDDRRKRAEVRNALSKRDRDQPASSGK